MFQTLMQIVAIFILVFIMRDMVKTKKYRKWSIPIYIIVLLYELNFHNQLLVKSPGSFQIVLNSMTLIILGAIGWLMVIFRNNIV